ncbi:MAG: amidophosphoribosyltransferase, partial [Peptococcaceae bacterium]
MKAMIDLKGSYALVIMNEKKLYAVRDPYGNRPLCVGKLGEDGYVVASESCALDAIGATFLRDVEPGEILTIDENGIHSTRLFSNMGDALCVFEFIYFARPDSNIDGINVNKARRLMGRELGKEAPLDVDIVISVPDSGTTAAIGYAEEIGVPFTQGILKNRYAGRTFIQPSQELRELMVKLKLNPIRDALEGKRVAVVDDSIVRGTTSRKLVKLLREHGAKEVHFLVSAPPVKYPCYYGIDTGIQEELIAHKYDIDGICEYIGADSLHYLSMEGLLRSVAGSRGFCAACLDGNYPMGVPCNCKGPKDALE